MLTKIHTTVFHMGRPRPPLVPAMILGAEMELCSHDGMCSSAVPTPTDILSIVKGFRWEICSVLDEGFLEEFFYVRP